MLKYTYIMYKRGYLLMKKKAVNSLSTKIVLSVILTSLFSIFVILIIFEKTNKEAFYNIEQEKANIIARTIEPIVALNIYLNMKDKINQLSLNLIKNPNILSIKILKNKKIINEIKSKDYNKHIEESFTIKKSIFQPNSKKQIGTLILVYSNQNYKKLIHKYKKLSITLLITFGILSLLFSLYVKKLLFPIKRMAISLKNYSPDKKIIFPNISQNNEIGLISNALNNMQEKISKYSKEQKNINQFLEEKVNEKTLELRKQLYTDSLTGLKNRYNLLDRISKLDNGALLVIDIDYFREINDFFGHIAGDNILKNFSNRLKDIFQNNKNIEIKRLAGDEFAILFIQKPSKEFFIETANRLIKDVENIIFFHENSEISIRITIGGAYQLEKALEKADIALKSAKKQQKSFLIYDEKLNIENEYKENIEWVKILKNAIDKNKIVPYFQPIFDNKSNLITSYECLIRLIDDDGNIISPFKFLTIAKKSRQYNTLTKIMIEKSCKNFKNLDYDFSINLSVDDILDKNTVKYIKERIKKYNVAHKIIFEILESEGIENYEDVSLFIRDVKQLGCRIAIDDFGSGYSNFEYLLQLNVDYIKIDGTLIKNIDKDKNAQIIVETIINFAKKLNILTVAEFVHNETVYTKVKELDINCTQGFYLAEPQESINSI